MVRTLTEAAAAVAVEAAGTLRLATAANPCVTAIRVVELYSRPQNCSGSQRRGFEADDSDS